MMCFFGFYNQPIGHFTVFFNSGKVSMMGKGKISKALILVVVIVVLIVAVLKFVPLKEAVDSYSPQLLTATPQSPATTTLALRKGWLVGGSLNHFGMYFTNIVSLYIFEPDGKTFVLSRSYDFQHQQNDIMFNFTARVEGNYVFLMNATFQYAPPPPYEFQPEVTMKLHVYETGMTSIL